VQNTKSLLTDPFAESVTIEESFMLHGILAEVGATVNRQYPCGLWKIYGGGARIVMAHFRTKKTVFAIGLIDWPSQNTMRRL
jgi:hypothetical protein